MTNDGTQINIEVQVQNRQDMGQRSLYYWAKLYQNTLGRGENYENLRRTVAINLLGYSYLPLSGFHHMYGLYDETGALSDRGYRAAFFGAAKSDAAGHPTHADIGQMDGIYREQIER